MSARRVTLVAVLGIVLGLSGTAVAHAADDPVLTTPGAPVVVANEPHRLTLTWSPSTWIGEPGATPIQHEVRAWLGPNVYRSLGTTTGTDLTLTDLAPGTEYRLTVWAYTNAGYSLDSPVTPVRTAYGKARISYRNLSWSPTDNQIQHVLQVVNTGTAPLDLADVRIRYHLTFEGGNTSLVTNCDWAAIGCANVQRHIQFFPPPLPPGPPTPTPTPTVFPPPGTPIPGWIELTFTGGELAPGESTGPIYLRHHRPNWTAIDERDDLSWQQATGEWADNSRITLDVNDIREYGDTNA
ncbi:cellulose binding domain-containing protein [Verrucosispora sioxanthis]|uniref:Glycosyl hydrolase family 5 n=1 Tax=Verrucosispora sioxanthis TaxID=2499994 RepID=A0A6M1LCU5_9ACTN|nr:cellulose binding domain-containing protein [Verrucosispora sioxanthis]NEE67013.1 glycosyl hydrolase family 5 [Verrucosispora sioxanthis]NGM16123.1 glycosyl hydrolase family 5 [Verrucosispora sioxanthis]